MLACSMLLAIASLFRYTVSARSTSTPPGTFAEQVLTAQGQAFGSSTHPPYAQSPHLHPPGPTAAHLSHPGFHHPQHMLEGTAELIRRSDASPDTVRSSTDPSPVSLASTSIIPEHLDAARRSKGQQNRASPPYYGMQSPDPSLSGYISTSSSPNYMQQQHQGQPMYAYHSQSITAKRSGLCF